MKNEEQKLRRDKWRTIVDKYLQSGITQKAFCEQHNLSLPQLVYYHAQFKRIKVSPLENASFVPVKIPSREKPMTVSEIKLALPNGFQCIFPSHTDVVYIRRLVEVLLPC